MPEKAEAEKMPQPESIEKVGSPLLEARVGGIVEHFIRHDGVDAQAQRRFCSGTQAF
jgi:hypothetical protein